MTSNPMRYGWSFYANGVTGNAAVRQEMTRVRQLAGASGGYVYSAACLPIAQRRTIRREWYHTAKALLFLWKTLISCGSDD